MLTFLHPEVVKRFFEVNNLHDLSPSLESLRAIGRSFQRIPYENLTKMIRLYQSNAEHPDIRLPEVLLEEHLRLGTGGTCFSMTYFLQSILRQVGFETYPVMADRPLAPNTHCASIVILDQKNYLIDPGFMIDDPVLMTDTPTTYDLNHTTIIIGRKGTIPIPDHQLHYFKDLAQKRAYEKNLPFEENMNVPTYTIATITNDKPTIRYFFKNDPISADDFLDFWRDSFNWTSLHNLSITVATERGYIYSRNNFLRTTTHDGRKQERIKKGLDLALGKTFNIDRRIIREAFEVLDERRLRGFK